MTRILAVVMLVAFAGSAHAQDIWLEGTWVNQGKSVMRIVEVNRDDGSITGTYVNNESNYKCVGEVMELSGWFIDELVTFSVRWKNENVDCQSLTTWIGPIEDGTIKTEWSLWYMSGAGPRPIGGHDVFRRAE